MGKVPKILLWDIESLPLTTATFTLFPERIGHDNILTDCSLICAAWKELGKKTIYSSSILDNPKAFKQDVNNDLVVIKKLRDVMEDVDILIGHNSKKFDTKKLNARLIFYGLDPLPSGIIQLDTLSEVRKIANFTSNRLDYLGKHLLGSGKLETSKGLWLRVLKGEKKAVEEMLVYNKQDVKVLEDVYLKLRPYIKNHPNVGVLHGEDREDCCPACGSTELDKIRTRFTAAGVKKQQKQCTQCHAYSTHIFK